MRKVILILALLCFRAEAQVGPAGTPPGVVVSGDVSFNAAGVAAVTGINGNAITGAPSVSSCGSGATIAGVASSFDVTVGSTPGSTCAITMPVSTTNWNCAASDITHPGQEWVTVHSSTGVTITNYVLTTGVAGNFTASDDLAVVCMPH